MSNGSTADPGNLYAPYVNPSALISMSATTPDGNITHGSDAVPTKPGGVLDVSSWVSGILDNVPLFSTAAKTGALAGTQAGATPQRTVATQTLIWSVILVVVGLMLLSRGFGLIGEEGEGVIVNLADPAKYPGIGHAIQGIKKGRK